MFSIRCELWQAAGGGKWAEGVAWECPERPDELLHSEWVGGFDCRCQKASQVAVVQAGQNHCLDHELGAIVGEKGADSPDVVFFAWPGHRHNVHGEGQSVVHHRGVSKRRWEIKKGRGYGRNEDNFRLTLVERVAAWQFHSPRDRDGLTGGQRGGDCRGWSGSDAVEGYIATCAFCGGESRLKKLGRGFTLRTPIGYASLVYYSLITWKKFHRSKCDETVLKYKTQRDTARVKQIRWLGSGEH